MLQCSMNASRRRALFGAPQNHQWRTVMPRGAYTSKQDRKAEHIEEGYEKRGVSKKEAERRAWATVNKQDKGGKNSGSGRSRSRSAAAKKGWETRRRHGKG
jgi:plasmid stabilization system protein ParE